MVGGGEERGWRPDVGTDQMRMLDAPLIEEQDQELAHRDRREQLSPPFGAAEAR
jgi:hypothetical protein